MDLKYFLKFSFKVKMIFQCSGIPVFRHLGVPAFRCSGIQVFRHSGVPAFLILLHAWKYRLLVKPGTPEQRNTGTPEQHHSGTRNTGTLKILNLFKNSQKKYRGGVKVLLQ